MSADNNQRNGHTGRGNAAALAIPKLSEHKEANSSPKAEHTASTVNADGFRNLSNEDVQINLRLLSDLKEGEKLLVEKNSSLRVDQRYAQCVRRYWSADSREKTLKFIKHVIDAAKGHCQEAVENVLAGKDKLANMDKLLNMQTLLRSASDGLGRIANTYSDDKHNLATINTFKSAITVFCDQDLKRVLEQ
jgi:hypothetical protein